MTTRLRLRQLIDELNEHREKAGLPIVSDRSIAEAAGIEIKVWYRLTRNERAGAEQFLGILDRVMDVLSNVAGREIVPTDVIERLPNKRSTAALSAGQRKDGEGGPPRPTGRRPRPAT